MWDLLYVSVPFVVDTVMTVLGCFAATDVSFLGVNHQAHFQFQRSSGFDFVHRGFVRTLGALRTFVRRLGQSRATFHAVETRSGKVKNDKTLAMVLGNLSIRSEGRL